MKNMIYFWIYHGFPGGSEVKASSSNAGDPGSILGLGRSPGEGNGNPLQYPCLENLMDRGAWQATVHGGCKESDTTERLHFLSFTLWIYHSFCFTISNFIYNYLKN